jgi:hypothetical protein
MNDHPLITYRLGIFSIIVYEVFLKESMLNLVGLHLPLHIWEVAQYLCPRTLIMLSVLYHLTSYLHFQKILFL